MTLKCALNYFNEQTASAVIGAEDLVSPAINPVPQDGVSIKSAWFGSNGDTDTRVLQVGDTRLSVEPSNKHFPIVKHVYYASTR